jgi:predicted negative regulator of RcsB-dependent stress response
MAYYDLEEQEQLATLKSWWGQYGTLVLIGVALAFAGLAGFQIWNWYKGEQAVKASVVYAELQKLAESGDAKKSRAAAATLTKDYPRSGYATLGSLVAARLSFEAGDLAAARENLQWVIDQSRDEDMKSLARFRLAGVLLDEKKFDDALKLLDVKPEDSMANLFADLRGDVLVAKGAEAEARAAYQMALEKTDAQSPYRSLIQIKLDSLGQPK